MESDIIGRNDWTKQDQDNYELGLSDGKNCLMNKSAHSSYMKGYNEGIALLHTHGGKRPGSGRKPSANPLKSYPVRLEISDYEAIPGNKQEFIRQAVKEKLGNSGRFYISNELLTMVSEALSNNWFSDGGEYSNDDIIEADKRLTDEINTQKFKLP